MRRAIAALVVLCALSPRYSSAQTSPLSAVLLAHSTLTAGQRETVRVLARDLAGRPLLNASVSVIVRFAPRPATYRLPKTGATGLTTLTFNAPAGSRAGRISVVVTITSGYLKQTVSATFSLKTGGGSGLPHPTRTGGPTASPTATGSPTPNESGITIRALPPQATAPDPVYLVVHAAGPAGDEPGAAVSASASFKEGTEQVTGDTDQYGVATLRIDTGRARINETVDVAASVTWKGKTTRTSTSFDVLAPQATATPTSTPTATAGPQASATPTWTALPPQLAAPLATSTPTWTPTSTPTFWPTTTPTPTSTPVPTDTPTPLPTDTPTPTFTPTPTDTPTPTPACPGSQEGCMQAMLNILNSTRAQYGVAPLTLNPTQSSGTSTCIGSYGHSVHMAQAGVISHDQFGYPPNGDICSWITPVGENVGEFSSGNELTDLQQINNLMMQEPHTPGCQGNHACNILYAQYQQVGIGIYYASGSTWLTEDFLG